jgi:hypothetical protein
MSRRSPGYRQQLHLRNRQAAEVQVIALPSPEVEVLERAVERSTAAAAAEEEAATPARWELVVGLSALVALICSVDRAAMSVALGPMGAFHHFVRPGAVSGLAVIRAAAGGRPICVDLQ